MARAMDVAMYLVYLRDADVRSREAYCSLTNLKLQKLLYYCHGGHYRWDNTKLINDNNFECWAYGPVIREVYYALQYTGQNDIPRLDYLKCRSKYKHLEHYKKALTADERETIRAIWEQLKTYSTFDLVNQTLAEAPSKNASESGILYLSDSDIKEYFRCDVVSEPINNGKQESI